MGPQMLAANRQDYAGLGPVGDRDEHRGRPCLVVVLHHVALEKVGVRGGKGVPKTIGEVSRRVAHLEEGAVAPYAWGLGFASAVRRARNRRHA